MPPPSRSYWKGYLRLALVTIPVQVHSAVEPSHTATHWLHKPSGKRVNYEMTVGGKPVDKSDVVKAYAVAEDTYITLEPEELDAVKLESKKTLDLKEFVRVEEIDPRYFEQPYYITPEDEFAAEGYMVIQAALKEKGRLGLGQVTMSSGREYLVAVGPVDRGLAMYILRYANEIRAAEKYFGDVPDKAAPAELVNLATQLINEHTRPFKPDEFQNSYEVALLDLVKRKSKGQKIVAKEPEPGRASGAKVVDLMEALRKSVTGKKEEAPAKKPKKGRKAG